MLPKKNRADTKAVDKIFKEGRFISSLNMTFKFIPTKLPLPRISVVVPKSVAKLAVKRNSLRRKAYSILEKYIKDLPPLSGVLVFKKYQDDVLVLKNEIETILSKIN